MKRVLFVCIHNSARSQMAEAYLRQLGGADFEVESAGLEPTSIHPLVVEAMAEEGIDLAGKPTQSVFALFRQGKLYQDVITVCSESAESACPIFPGVTRRLHLPFPDPAAFTGSHAERLAQVRTVRDAIKAKMAEYVAWHRQGATGPLSAAWRQHG